MDSNNTKMGIIYVATNIHNNKKYVGLTRKTLDERIKGHLKSVKKGSGCKFHNEIREIGIDSFIFESFEYPSNKLDKKEKEYIEKFDSFNNGYNSNLGGNSCKGYKHTDDAKHKSAWNRGKKLTEEHKSKIAKSHLELEFHHTNESKTQMGITRKGKYKGISQTEDHKNKKIESLKKANYINFRKIKITKPNNEIIEFQGSIQQLCKSNNLIRRDVYFVLNGKRQHHKNWKFEYLT